MHEIKLRRVYEPIEKVDGFRILIDRLWPRGISKEKGRTYELRMNKMGLNENFDLCQKIKKPTDIEFAGF